MALIESVTISQLDRDTARLSWTGAEDKRVWVAVNGGWISRNLEYSGTSRTADIVMRSDAPKCVEVHEVGSDVNPTPLFMAPNKRPTVNWDSVSDAHKYTVYQREGASGTDSSVADVYETGKTQYDAEPRSDLNIDDGGTWHYFRVTAKDAYGVESATVAEKISWLVDIPDSPSGVELSGSNGTFSITLTL